MKIKYKFKGKVYIIQVTIKEVNAKNNNKSLKACAKILNKKDGSGKK